MDPVSLTLTIAGLAPAVASAITGIRSFYSAIHDAPEDISNMLAELQALQGNLRSITSLLQHDTVLQQRTNFPETSVLVACSAALKTKLEQLSRGLLKKSTRLLWPLKKQEHNDLLQGIRNFTLWMHFALSIEGCKVLSNTSDDVVALVESQARQVRILRDVEDQTSRIEVEVRESGRVLRDEEQRRVLEWVSGLEFEERHYEVRKDLVTGTGGWLVKEPEFEAWRNDVASPDVLWCTGDPGAGKTFLLNTVIDELTSSTPDDKISVCYYYFEYSKEDCQSPLTVLRSFLRQLVQQCPEWPEAVETLYRKVKGVFNKLTIEDCETLIADTARHYQTSYFLLDALDKCNRPEDRRMILKVLQRLAKKHHTRIFVTSRPHVPEIKTTFEKHARIHVKARKEDLEQYIHQTLKQRDVYREIDQDFALELKTTLISLADGMFLLLYTHLNLILQEEIQGEMEDVLDSLVSGSPTDAFAKTIARIQSSPKASVRRWAMQSLMWISCAERGLLADELVDLLAVKPEQSHVRKTCRPRPEMILEYCLGLVKLDERTGQIHLAHYHVQEYLLENRAELFGDPEVEMARTCLRYLTLDDFKEKPCNSREAIKSRGKEYPFLRYAVKYVGGHVRQSQEDGEVQTLVALYLKNDLTIATVNQMMRFNGHFREEYYCAEESLSVTPLHEVCRLGWTQALSNMLKAGTTEIDVQTHVVRSTPLILAASAGHTECMTILLDHGADPYLSNWYGNSLHCAAESGKTTSITTLLRRGMSPNACERYEKGPIFCTIDRDSLDALKELVRWQADLNVSAKKFSYTPFFHRATFNEAVRIVEWMLQRQPELLHIKSRHEYTALHWAVLSRSLAMTQLLIRAGADPGSKDDNGLSPLDHARMTEDQDLLQLLSSGRKQIAEPVITE